MPNATPETATPSGFVISDGIGTFPAATIATGSVTTFDSAHPNVISVASWPLTTQQTKTIYGVSFWLFHKATGQIAYGQWVLNESTHVLTFLCIDGYPKFTVNIAGTGAAYGINRSLVATFNQCSIKCTVAVVTIVGVTTLDTPGETVTLTNGGNSMFPVIIDASSSAACKVITGTF